MSLRFEDTWKQGVMLGSGGQANTFLATKNEDPSVTGVIKFLRDPTQKNRGRMHTEVSSLNILGKICPNVPSVLDHNTDHFDDRSLKLFVVMEYFPGETLHQYVQSQKHLTIEESIGFVLSLCETVRVAHDAGVLHRDIKPQNIIVRDKTAMSLGLVDYGLSFNTTVDGNTQPGDVLRNQFIDLPETMTPNGSFRNPVSDVTAICAILYYCLTGHVPRQLQDGRGDPPHRWKGFSVSEIHSGPQVRQLEYLLDRGLSVPLSSRFQTVEELIIELSKALKAEDLDNISDPKVLALALSQNVRAVDRNTQLGEIAKKREAIQQIINALVAGLNNKIGDFRVELVGIGNTHEFQLPAGVDMAATISQVLRVKQIHHPFSRICWHALGARGNQCVILRTSYLVPSDQKMGIKLNTGWDECLAFDGDPAAVKPLLEHSLNSWLCDQLRFLNQEISALNASGSSDARTT